MFEKELEIACYAVLEAMRMTRKVQYELAGNSSITKSDKSPVTIADFLAQAIVCQTLKKHFPSVAIVGEEDSQALQSPDNREVLESIYKYIERDEAISKLLSRENLFQSIDLGGDEPRSDIFWTLDPVDGTKGFLRGEQYAVALALVVENRVHMGILGCPNLDVTNDKSSRGFLFHAIRDEGAKMFEVATHQSKRVTVSDIADPTHMRFVESFVSSHSNQDLQEEIAGKLKIGGDPVRMDSQVKYGTLAAGYAEIYLRIPNPKTPDYKEKIWDHAAGSIIVEEAGGVVTDIYGKKLDFSAGKTLANNSGIAAAVPAVHSNIIELVNRATK